jgi:hypothetical protein
MLISRTVSVNDTPVDLVGEEVDLDRAYALHIRPSLGGATIRIGDEEVSASSGYLLTSAPAAPFVLRGERLFAVVAANSGSGPVSVDVLAYGV